MSRPTAGSPDARGGVAGAAQKISSPRQAGSAQQSSRSGTRADSDARDASAIRDRFRLIPGGAQRSRPDTGACDFCTAPVSGGFAFEASEFTVAIEFVSVPEFSVSIEERWWCACTGCAQLVWAFDWTAIVDRHCDQSRASWSPWRPDDLAELFEQLDGALTGRWCTWSMAGAA